MSQTEIDMRRIRQVELGRRFTRPVDNRPGRVTPLRPPATDRPVDEPAAPGDTSRSGIRTALGGVGRFLAASGAGYWPGRLPPETIEWIWGTDQPPGGTTH